jgi:pimeloyl-ACP methyl ester carboxylesterase
MFTPGTARLTNAIERDRFWNLDKQPIPGFRHHFLTLRNGLKLHYISNGEGALPRNLIIFLHGFPDSSMMWRHLMQEPAMPVRDTTMVCVDLPGYGGSDSLDQYDTEVLEALTEFIIAMRERYISAESSDNVNTFIVGHDWGCLIGFRLASEAPSLADRFILMNAPHVGQTLESDPSIEYADFFIGRARLRQQGQNPPVRQQDIQTVQTITQE